MGAAERAQTLSVDGIVVARWEDGAAMPENLSPRPYLHPIVTLSGTPATETGPADHPHHYGLSQAIADIDGTNYWGGPSYVDPEGYRMLADHGRQRIVRSGVPDSAANQGAALEQEVEWIDAAGEHHLSEQRRVGVCAQPAMQGWSLQWRSVLHADARELVVGSPATRGRTGAGYGGLFWRVGPQAPTRVVVDDGEGEQAALGCLSPWLLLEQDRPGGVLSLLLMQSGPLLPWFVRTGGYVGAGPAVAWEQTRTIGLGDTLEMTLTALVREQHTSSEDARAWAQALAGEQRSGS